MIKIGENLSVMTYWEWRAESKLAEWCVGNAPYELNPLIIYSDYKLSKYYIDSRLSNIKKLSKRGNIDFVILTD